MFQEKFKTQNKMALQKLNYYIGVLLVVSLLMGGLITTGQALLDKDRITLSPDSEDYVNLLIAQSEDADINSIYNSNSSETKQKSLLGETEEGGIPVVSDALAVLNFFRNIGSSIANFFKIVYNIPTIMLISLGLPILEFSFILNTLTYIIFISLIIALATKILK